MVSPPSQPLHDYPNRASSLASSSLVIKQPAPQSIDLYGLYSCALSRGRAGPGELPMPALPGGLVVLK